MSTHQLGIKCSKCGADEWSAVDRPTEYIEFCNKCCESIVYQKQDFVDNFECKECGCLEGKLEENNKAIAVRCTNCGKAEIVLRKHDPLNKRHVNQEKPKVHCPKCGSTQITAGARGVNAVWGLIGASKTVNRCAKCGYTWKPGKR